MKTASDTMTQPLTPRQHAEAYRNYLTEIQPWVQMQVNLMNMQPVRYSMTASMHIATREVLWNPDAKEAFDQIEVLKQEILRRYFP